MYVKSYIENHTVYNGLYAFIVVLELTFRQTFSLVYGTTLPLWRVFYKLIIGL